MSITGQRFLRTSGFALFLNALWVTWTVFMIATPNFGVSDTVTVRGVINLIIYILLGIVAGASLFTLSNYYFTPEETIMPGRPERFLRILKVLITIIVCVAVGIYTTAFVTPDHSVKIMMLFTGFTLIAMHIPVLFFMFDSAKKEQDPHQKLSAQ